MGAFNRLTRVHPLFFLISAMILAPLSGGCDGGSGASNSQRAVAGRSGGGTTKDGSLTGGSTGKGGETSRGSSSSGTLSGGGAGRSGESESGAGGRGDAGRDATASDSSHGGSASAAETTGGNATSGAGTKGSAEEEGGSGGNGGSKSGGTTARTGGSNTSSSASGGAPQPSTFKVFDQIPQFGIYAERDPKNYRPPEGMLMWGFGTLIVKKLSSAERARILSKLSLRITYHAQCDNYDRLGSLFFILKSPGQAPVETDPRIEIARYITPFSNYSRGALATYVFADADISAYAGTLANPSQDVWLGIASGANPYDGDPCTDAQVTAEFRQVGYKISAELVSSGPALAGAATTLSAKSAKSETSLPIRGNFENPGEALSGRVTVIVSAHGSSAGGCEYMHTDDVLRVNDEQIGAFSTQVDCANYARYSPDGNQGIFRNNGTTNPRNWCPGALVIPRTYPVTLKPGSNSVTLAISPSQVPSGSYYSTTIVFTSP